MVEEQTTEETPELERVTSNDVGEQTLTSADEDNPEEGEEVIDEADA